MAERDENPPEIYALEPEALKAPPLPGEAIMHLSAEDALERLAADLLAQAETCVRDFGDFHLALSGGAEFDPFLRQLIIDPAFRRLPWIRTHLWIVHEPAVAPHDERSAARQIREWLADHAGIPGEQIHVPGAGPFGSVADGAAGNAGGPAAAYEAALRETLGWRERGEDRLDFVLLGVNESGGCAGFEPGDAWQESLRGSAGAQTTARGTGLSLRVISEARVVALLACGAERRRVIQSLSRREPEAESWPCANLARRVAALRWYLDLASSG